MMIINFNQEFKQAIIDGVKIHTIRRDIENRWKQGKKLLLCTKIEKTIYNSFLEPICISTQKIFMTYKFNDVLEITIEGKYLYYPEKLELALNSGFKNWKGFFDFFYPKIQANKNKCYSGKLIHWTDKKY